MSIKSLTTKPPISLSLNCLDISLAASRLVCVAVSSISLPEVAFDELIDASKLQESIIISPFYTGKKEVKYKKNEVSITFDTLFDENTTYIINFAGGISDVTEGNDLSNAKLIFSTGEYIDSASISGVIYNPNENKRVEGALVGLYQ